MPWQLIFTSAPRGLTPGQSGYCTVARSDGLREALIPRLEKLSYFTPESGANPVICAHRLIEVRDLHYHILSRIVDAGLDFTKRRKFLAHHLVFELEELALAPSPALIFQEWSGWINDWESDPILLPQTAPLPEARAGFGEWEKLTGRAENAKALLQIDGWLTGDGHERKVFMALLEEALRGHPKSWQFSFTNCFQPGDEPGDFRLRAIWPKTPGFERALQMGAAPMALRELRAHAVRESAPIVETPVAAPEIESTPPPSWNPRPALLAGGAALLVMVAAVLVRNRPPTLVTTPEPQPISNYVEEVAVPTFPGKAPDLSTQLEKLFPKKPTWLAAGNAAIGPAPELERLFRMLRDSEIFGKDIHATLQGKPAAVNARPQENRLVFSEGVDQLDIRVNDLGPVLLSLSPQRLILEINGQGRFIFVPPGAPLKLSREFLKVDTNAQTVFMSAPLESRLRELILPVGAQLALRPQKDFIQPLEEDFALRPATYFDFGATRSQVKRVVQEKEKVYAALKSEFDDLRARERKQITGSRKPEDLQRKERLTVLNLAFPRATAELKTLREKATRVPHFRELDAFSLFLCQNSAATEILRFTETGEAP